MRKPIMAGNWKMNNTIAEAVKLATGVKAQAADVTKADVVLCPAFTAIAAVADAVSGTNITVGAQDMYWEESGAFTGEVSPLMLEGLCQYVIFGHSERREYFGETNETVNNKVKAALAHGFTPIVCCGESLEQNQAGETVSFISSQIRGALDGLTAEQVAGLVIAYEPIWAIGTGLTAEPEAVNTLIKESIRDVVAAMFDDATAQSVRVQYGGSVKPGNVDDFMAQSEIDGALVGGAALDADSFVALVNAAANAA